MSTAAALVAAAGPAAPALRPVITGPTDTAVAREDQRTLRGKLFQILWHADPLTGVNRALHSVDCHPTEPVFALCSIDKEFSLWRLKPTPTTSGTPGATSTLATPAIAPASGVRTDVARHADVEVEHIAKVEGHDASVNVVRFSPNGECLATAGDDHAVLVWRPRPGFSWATVTGRRDLLMSICRGPLTDVYDIAWSPDSTRVLAGCVDGTSLILDARGGAPQPLLRLRAHAHYVQGVAWDPAGGGVVTQSSDRTVRVYAVPEGRGSGAAALDERGDVPPSTELRLRAFPAAAVAAAAPATAATAIAPAVAAAAAHVPLHHALFLDESLPSFFRRCAFSPDGALLLTPAALFRAAPDAAPAYTTYAWARGEGLAGAAPVAHYPGPPHGKPSVAVRFSPVVYCLRQPQRAAAADAAAAAATNGAFALPYRLVFAVATLDSVFVWDTQAARPLGMMTMFHVDKITDLAWSADGRVLLVTSLDGYVSAATFAPGDLGEPLSKDDPAYPSLLRRTKPLLFGAPAPAAAGTSVPPSGSLQPPPPAAVALTAAMPVAADAAAPSSAAGTAAAAAAAAAATHTAAADVSGAAVSTPGTVTQLTVRRRPGAGVPGEASATAVAPPAPVPGMPSPARARADGDTSAAATAVTVAAALATVPTLLSPQRTAAAAALLGGGGGSVSSSPARRRIVPVPLAVVDGPPGAFGGAPAEGGVAAVGFGAAPDSAADASGSSPAKRQRLS